MARAWESHPEVRRPGLSPASPWQPMNGQLVPAAAAAAASPGGMFRPGHKGRAGQLQGPLPPKEAAHVTGTWGCSGLSMATGCVPHRGEVRVHVCAPACVRRVYVCLCVCVCMCLYLHAGAMPMCLHVCVCVCACACVGCVCTSTFSSPRVPAGESGWVKEGAGEIRSLLEGRAGPSADHAWKQVTRRRLITGEPGAGPSGGSRGQSQGQGEECGLAQPQERPAHRSARCKGSGWPVR